MAYNPFMAATDDGNTDTGSGSSGKNQFLISTRAADNYRAKKKKEDEEKASIAAEIKGKADAQAQKIKDQKDKRNIAADTVGAVGHFIQRAAIDVKDTTVGAFKGTKTAFDSISANSQVQRNTSLMQENSKEWNKFMMTLPQGDEKAWSDPKVQEKLKEFKYKNALLQGREVAPEDVPESARKAQEAAIKAHKDGIVNPHGFVTKELTDPKTGQLSFKPEAVDPYERYRGAAITADTKNTLKDLQGLDAKKLAAQDAETFLNIATLGIGTGLKQGAKMGVKEGVKTIAEQGIKEGTKAAVKTAGKAGSKAALGEGAKGLAIKAGEDAAIGGAYGITTTLRNDENNEAGLSDYAKNILLGASIGAAIPVAGKTVKHLATKTDHAAGATVQKAGEKILDKKSPITATTPAVGAQIDDAARFAAEDTAMRRSLKLIGEHGIVGTIDRTLSRGGKTVAYKVGDLIGSTKAGAKVQDLADDFSSKWITNFSPLYKTLKRSDFEGRTQGAYVAAREAIGNSNRSLSYAQDFIENNSNMQQLTAAIAADGTDLVKARAKFDEYAAVRSELDLLATGKKTFSKAKTADLKERMAAFEGKEPNDQYKNLVDFYSDLNDFKLENGLMSKEEHQMFKDEPFDYIRQQREIPEWLQNKPNKSGGSTASIASSGLKQRRNQYAQGEVLSPIETAIKTAQLAHTEAYRNKAAKTVYSLLDEAGEAKLVRSTDMVKEKRALLTDLKATRPIATKLDRTVRSKTKALNRLQYEIDNLNLAGMKTSLKEGGERMDSTPFSVDGLGGEVPTSQAGRGGIAINDKLTEGERNLLEAIGIKNNPNKLGKQDTKSFLNSLVTADPAALKSIRKKIESRTDKHSELFDTVEVLNQNLHELHMQRKGLWDSARGIKTNPDKARMTSVSFLEDGIENVAEIDPVIAGAIHNWEKQSQNVMSDVLRRANNVFKYGTTGLNAGFALPNFVADQFSAAINSKSFVRQVSPINFTHSLFMAIGKPLTSQDAEWLRAYKAGNKGQLSVNQYTKATTSAKAANDLIAGAAPITKKTATYLRHPSQGAHVLFEGLEGAIGVTENLTRIQSFRAAAKKAGKEGLDAVDQLRTANQAARENSVDFQEMGDYGRVINNLIPYFNASIQGSRTMLRNASEHPASFTAKTAALVGMPIAATTIWNTMDEKRKGIYDTIPEYVKDTNFVVIRPDAHWNATEKKWQGVILMKKPQGFKEFAEPVRKFIEYKADGGEDMSGFLKTEGGSLAADFAQSLQPIDFSSPDKFLSSVTPQVLKPTAEAILNKNFFQGTDIVPSSMQDKAPEDQKYDQYSRLSASIAGMFNTSPLKVDLWIRETFGEAGTNVQNSIDHIANDNPDSIGGRDLQESITRRFSGAPGGANVDAFYESFNKASSARKITSAKVTELVKAGRINEAKRRAEEYNASIGDRFQSFMDRYKDTPNYDPEWDTRIDDLPIKTTEQAFKARRKIPN